MLCGPKKIYFCKPHSAHRDTSLHSHPAHHFPFTKIPPSFLSWMLTHSIHSVPFAWFCSQSRPFAQTSSVRRQQTLWIIGFGVALLKVCRRREVVVLRSSLWGTFPACSCSILGPPEERSGQHSEAEEEGPQRKNGGALKERNQRPMRDTSGFAE